MLEDILLLLHAKGCEIQIVKGTSNEVSADIAVMHVDTTRLPDHYARYAERFPFCLNARVADISKAVISEASITRTDDWQGPVIVKTQLNSRGVPEFIKNERAAKLGRPLPFPNAGKPRDYQLYRSLRDVPTPVWDDTSLIVDRFMPEVLPDGYAMCLYIFCGEYEFCARFVGTDPLVKGKNVFRHEVIPVPASIRNRRRELGFDYGKLDFVHYDGKAYLIDANKTPGRIPPSGGASLEGLAEGLRSLVEST